MTETVVERDTYLTSIAVDVYHSTRGSFLKAMADAWCKADMYNRRILQIAWEKIIKKYSLDEEEKP